MAHARVLLRRGEQEVIATLYHATSQLVTPDEAALSESAWTRLGLEEGDRISVLHPAPLDSLSHVRSRIYGHQLGESSMHAIIEDIVAGKVLDQVPAHLRGTRRHARAAGVASSAAGLGGPGRVRARYRQSTDRATRQACGRPRRQSRRRRSARRVGDRVAAGQPLCTVHADAPGELTYAFDYAATNRDIIVVREP